MRQRILTPVAVLAALTAGAALTACGTSGGIGGGTDAGGGRMSIPNSKGGPPDTRTAVPSSAAAAQSSSAAATNRADIHVSGGVTINGTGQGATCAYYAPDQHQGVSYTVNSAKLATATGDAGTWNLRIQDDTGSNLGVILTTSKGSWTSGATVDGTLTADTSLKGARFDLQLTDVSGKKHAHLQGSITCS